MDPSRPDITEEHLAPELHIHRAGDGPPEVIVIVDSDEEGLPIISSDDEEEGEYEVSIRGAFPPLPLYDEVEFDRDMYWLMDLDEEDDEDSDEEEGILYEGRGTPPLSSDDEAEFEDEEDDEDSDDEEDWDVSEDSGYESMLEDEEDSEDDDDEDIRPRSPLIQQLPPVNFQQGWREEYPAVPPCPFGAPLSFPWKSLAEFVGLTIFGPSTERNREESEMEQVSVQRPKTDCEEHLEESAPSTSGLRSSTNRSGEDSHRHSVPSTSGLGSSTNRSYWMSHFPHLLDDDSDSD